MFYKIIQRVSNLRLLKSFFYYLDTLQQWLDQKKNWKKGEKLAKDRLLKRDK